MQFAVDAMPSKSILNRMNPAEGDLFDIFANLPEDVDPDEILRRLEDIINRDQNSILDAPVVCGPGYRPNGNNICKPIL